MRTQSLDNLKAAYDALEKDSNEALDANIKKNRELLAELEAKQKAMTAEQDKLNKLKVMMPEIHYLTSLCLS